MLRNPYYQWLDTMFDTISFTKVPASGTWCGGAEGDTGEGRVGAKWLRLQLPGYIVKAYPIFTDTRIYE